MPRVVRVYLVLGLVASVLPMAVLFVGVAIGSAVPGWAFAAVPAASLGVFGVAVLRFLRRLRACGGRLCPACGYALVGLDEDGVCPECGTKYTARQLRYTWQDYLGGK